MKDAVANFGPAGMKDATHILDIRQRDAVHSINL